MAIKPIGCKVQEHSSENEMPPLALYLHVPFCLRKCPYCDFSSQVFATLPEQRYLGSVKQELWWRRQQLANDSRPLRAIFFGGGTPSLFNATTIAGFLEQILALWPVETGCEITLEANPESATLEKMRAWRSMGINRLSLGIQAFDATRLAFLQRPHDLQGARRAIRNAAQAGFDNLNLDLIYATPGHTPDIWRKELAEAIAWEPRHISCYQLSIEPETPFFRRSQDPSWVAVDETLGLALWQQTWETLAQGGWSAYEISNFAHASAPPLALPATARQWGTGTVAFACRHNRNYWSFGDYLGIGSGAHGKLSTIRERDGRLQVWRSVNPATPESYMAAMEVAGPPWPLRRVSAAMAGRECLLMGLRHDEGVKRSLYHRLTGTDLAQNQAQNVALMLEAGYLTVDSTRLCLTEKGVPLADAITLKLL